MLDGVLATSLEEMYDLISPFYTNLPMFDSVKFSGSIDSKPFDPTGDIDYYLLLPDNKVIVYFDKELPPVMAHFYSNGVLVAGSLYTYTKEPAVAVSPVPRNLLEQLASLKPQYYLNYRRIDSLHSTPEEIEEYMSVWNRWQQYGELVDLSLNSSNASVKQRYS